MFNSLGNNISQSNSTSSLFGQNYSSAPFALSGSRGIFNSTTNSSINSFVNPLTSTSIGVGNSFFSSSFPTSTSNSFFPSTPRGEIFSSISNFSPNISSSSFSTLGNSGIFSNQSKLPSLGINSQSSNGLFQQSTSIFNSATGPGTPIPFRAVQSQDTVMKGGSQINVQVRLECIPAMKEYENKSLEELRYEDYLTGRKGNANITLQSQLNPQPGFFSSMSSSNLNGRGLFSTTTTSSNMFSSNLQASQNSNFFGPKSQASLFGQVSQNTKSFASPSNPLFLNTMHAQGSNLFQNANVPHLYNTFPLVNSTAQNSSVIFSANQSIPFGNKSSIGINNSNSSLNLGINPLAKPSSIFPPHPTNSNISSQFLSPQSNNMGNITNRPFDLSFRKSTAVNLPSNFAAISNPIIFSASNSTVSSPFVAFNEESPSILQRQLLFLARTPFGESPLFKDASQTIDTSSSVDKINYFKSIKEFSSTKSKSVPPNNLFKMKFQPTPLLSKGTSLNSSFLNELDEKCHKVKHGQVLVSRKISVKHLDLVTNKTLPSQLHIDESNANHSPRISDQKDDNNALFDPSNLDCPDEAYEDAFQVHGKNQLANESAFSNIIRDANDSNFKSALLDDFHIEHDLLTLKRLDYYTSPSCLDITKLFSNDRLIVNDFTIFRHGYGNIFFPGKTDITGINLDENVFIERKEVTVYPKECNKPSIGQGLNKEAFVSLTDVWPICKVTREAITDSSKILALHYFEKVERCTEKLGAQFIDYDLEGGVWKFKVIHFSKFKLDVSDSSDSEENDKTIEKKAFKTISRESSLPSRPKSSEFPSIFIQPDPQEHVEIRTGSISNANYDSPNISSQMHLLFSRSHHSSIPPKSIFVNDINLTKPSLNNESAFSSMYNLNRIKICQEKSQLVNPDWRITNFSSSLSLTISPKRQSILHICSQNVSDSSLFINRSFRVGWSNSSLLGFTLPLKSFSVILFKFTVSNQKSIGIYTEISLNSFLKNLLNITEKKLSSALNDNIDLFSTFFSCRNFNIYEEFDKSATLPQHSFVSLIWELLYIIIAKRDCQKNITYSLYMNFHDKFCKWLSKLQKPFLNQFLEERILFRILYELAAGNIHSACLLALNNDDYHLAHTISQSLSNKSSVFKKMIRAQIDNWLLIDAISFISPIRFTIYCFLCGEFELIFSLNYQNVFHQFKWFHYFALIFWFTESPNSNIANSLLSFNELYTRGCFFFPTCTHGNDLIQSRKFTTPDLLYSLIANTFLNTYSLLNVLNNASYTSLLLDYSLSFQILLTLSYSENVSILQRSSIIMNFTNQLLFINEWHWALFILLFLPPSGQKKSVINSIVEHYCTNAENLLEEELFILNDLYFDSNALFLFKSNLVLYYKNYILHSDFLIKANQPNLAHETIIGNIISPCIINENFTLIKEKIRQIECAGRTNLIEHWESEGSIFLDYVRILETINKLLDGFRCSATELQHLLQGVRSLCYRISQSQINSSTFRNFLAISEISKNLLLFLKVLIPIENNSLYSTSTFSQETIKYFTKLPLLCDNFNGICFEMCENYLSDIN